MLVTSAEKFKTIASEACRTLTHVGGEQEPVFRKVMLEAINAQVEQALQAAFQQNTQHLLATTFGGTANVLALQTGVGVNLAPVLAAYRRSNPSSDPAATISALTDAEFRTLQALMRELDATLGKGGVCVQAQWSFPDRTTVPSLSLTVSVTSEHPVLGHLDTLRRSGGVPADPPSLSAVALSKQITDQFNAALVAALGKLQLDLANAPDPRAVLVGYAGRLPVGVTIWAAAGAGPAGQRLMDLASAAALARSEIAASGYRPPTVAFRKGGNGGTSIEVSTVAPLPQSAP